MYTGIIEDLGTVVSVKPVPKGVVLTVKTALPLGRVSIGDSICFNGVCVTVVSKARGRISADLSAETLRRSTLGELKPEGDSKLFRFEAPAGESRYLVEKGSVALDGISLTCFAIKGRQFSVALIPHTLKVTTMGRKQPGDKVNFESDMLVKYVEKMLAGRGLAAAAGA